MKAESYREPAEKPVEPVETPLTGFKRHEGSLAFLRVYRQDLSWCVGHAERLNDLKRKTNDFLMTGCVESCRKADAEELRASTWLQCLTLDDIECFRDKSITDGRRKGPVWPRVLGVAGWAILAARLFWEAVHR